MTVENQETNMTDYKKAGWLFCWGMVSLGLLLEILMNFLLVYIADWRVSEELMMCAWICIAFVCMWQPLLALRFKQKLFCWGIVLLAAQAAAMYAAYKQGSYAATMFCAGICAVLLVFSIMLLVRTVRRQTPSAAA